MARVIPIKSDIQATATLTLDEVELRALYGLTVYSPDAVLKAIYTQLGESYVKPHEAGLLSLLATIAAQVPAILKRAEDARAVFTGAKVASKVGS